MEGSIPCSQGFSSDFCSRLTPIHQIDGNFFKIGRNIVLKIFPIFPFEESKINLWLMEQKIQYRVHKVSPLISILS